MTAAKRPIIFAHRGASGDAPENTLAAFKLGLEQGCDGFELDVHLSQDGGIVVIHDGTIDRTTDGTGVVHEMTVDQLKSYDAGSWFDDKYKGEQIPLLEEVFDLAPEHITINVEIKGSYNQKLEPALVELLKRKNRLDSVVVSSFDWKCLQFIKELEPRIKIGLLYNIRLAHHEKLPAAAGVEVFSLHPQDALFESKDMIRVHAEGYAVYGWTINNEAKMKRALENGMDGIITNYPGVLRSILQASAAK